MSNFKIGDRVRVSELYEGDRLTDLKVGDMGEVVKIGISCIYVRMDRNFLHARFNFDTETGGYALFEWQLEKIERKNDMKLSDLKTGMVVETRNGGRYLVLQVENEVLLMQDNGERHISTWGHPRYKEDMSCEIDSRTIVKVFESVKIFNAVTTTTNVIWERTEPQELTLKEISERLGYPVKVVGE